MTSDLNSEVEENAKRKRIQKTFTSSEEDLETSLLSEPPILKTKTKIEQKKCNSSKKERTTSFNINQSTYDESSYSTENSKFLYLYINLYIN